MAAFTIPSIFTAIDKFSKPVMLMEQSLEQFAGKSVAEFARVERNLRSIQTAAFDVAKKSAIVGLAIVAPLGLAAKSAIDFQDKMADVAKTTGLSGKALEGYGDSILSISTKSRTGIDDLVKIGEIGGQLGVASNELVKFTEASNKFAVALGADYGGTEEAISQVGKINKLFKDTRGLDISSSITKAGSVINTLGAVGSGTSANINDFILRVGALPDALKPSMVATAALGTLLEENGVDAQIGASGYANFITTAGENIPQFAKQMKLSTQAAEQLFKTDPSKFASTFAASLNDIDPAKLPLVLKGYKLQSVEVLKTLGVLMTQQERLTKINGFAADSFAKGTSLQDEYNTKNATTAAKLEIAKNNMEALSITIGTQLLPIINSLIEKIVPLITRFTDWSKENPGLISTILKLALAIAAVSFAVSIGSTLVGAYAGIMRGYLFVVKAAAVANKIFTGWQLLFTGAMSLSIAPTTAAAGATTGLGVATNFALLPIIAIIAAVAALIAVVVLIVKYWNTWGAAIAIFLGPLGFVISLIQSFRRNWDMLVQSFQTGGIFGALKAIGKIFIDAILMPLQQLLAIAAKLPGKAGEWAATGADKIEQFRNTLGVNTTTDENGNPLPSKEAINPKQVEQDALVQRMEKTNTSSVNVNFNDPGKMIKNISGGDDLIGVKLSSTSTWAQ